MKKPYTICHILSALDGKIEGPFMKTEPAGKAGREYARIRDAYQADAWLYGTVTTKAFTNGRSPELIPGSDAGKGDFVADSHAPLYYVSVDTQGEIGWESGIFKKDGRTDAHVIEILTQQTPVTFRDYLRRRNVSYIIAGEKQLDCKIALEKLWALFGLETMLICGGGTVNWTFLQQGAIDELSLVIAPVADGNPDSVTVFEKSPLLSFSEPAIFRLKKMEQLKDEGVHLVYAFTPDGK